MQSAAGSSSSSQAARQRGSEPSPECLPASLPRTCPVAGRGWLAAGWRELGHDGVLPWPVDALDPPAPPLGQLAAEQAPVQALDGRPPRVIVLEAHLVLAAAEHACERPPRLEPHPAHAGVADAPGRGTEGLVHQPRPLPGIQGERRVGELVAPIGEPVPAIINACSKQDRRKWVVSRGATSHQAWAALSRGTSPCIKAEHPEALLLLLLLLLHRLLGLAVVRTVVKGGEVKPARSRRMPRSLARESGRGGHDRISEGAGEESPVDYY